MVKRLAVCILAVLAAATMAACLVDEDVKVPLDTYVPEQLDDGWELSTLEAEGFDPAAVDAVYRKFFSQDHYPTAHAMLVVRNGYLVAEAYCRDPADRHNFHHIQSATKSITSILTGIAVDKGLIESVNQSVYEFIPQFFDEDERKRSITIRHVLTMQTGLNFDNDIHTAKLYHHSGSTLRYVLSRPLDFEPGSSFYYHDGNPQLMSGVIWAVTGGSLEDFAISHLFDPLGIRHYRWETPNDGMTFGAFGLWLCPRDMAKIGKMMLQKGIWDGERIVSEEWVAESKRRHVTGEGYGFYWWVASFGGDYSAEGHGEQIIYVAPEENAVVVLTADSYSSDAALSPGYRRLIHEVLAAIPD